MRFAASSHWTDLGGSPDAEAYLRAFDLQGLCMLALAAICCFGVFVFDLPGAQPCNFPAIAGPLVSLLQHCSSKERETAAKICTKHFPEAEKTAGGHFEDCLEDVCSGGGEAAAELSAEVMKNDEDDM